MNPQIDRDIDRGVNCDLGPQCRFGADTGERREERAENRFDRPLLSRNPLVRSSSLDLRSSSRARLLGGGLPTRDARTAAAQNFAREPVYLRSFWLLATAMHRVAHEHARGEMAVIKPSPILLEFFECKF